MLLVKLCPNGIKFRAQTTKQSTLDPVFDKKFSFSVSQNIYETNCIVISQWNEKSKGIQIDLLNSCQNGTDIHIGFIRIMKNELNMQGEGLSQNII